jgi:hypothetical protein
MTGLNTQRKVVGREQDSRETEREGGRGRVLLQMSDGVGNKICHCRKYL